jgi:hypothetical protein
MPARAAPSPEVTALHLRDPATGNVVRELTDDVTVPMNELPAGATVTAEVGPGTGSVTFEFDGAAVKTESEPPLCLSGDVHGKLLPFSRLTPGPHVLRVTPFPLPGARGAAGGARVVRLSVVPEAPEPPPADAETGWTEFPLAPGAREVYVAQDGDDANSGLAPDQPVATILRGYALLRNGKGDHLLLRRGDTFRSRTLRWRLGGKPSFPALIGSYGDPSLPRPLWLAESTGIEVLDPVKHVAFADLELRSARRDPQLPGFAKDAARDDSYGIRVIASVQDFRLEGLLVARFADNVLFHAPGPAGTKRLLRDVTVFRCVIVDAWSRRAFGGQGIFVGDVDGLRIAECVFDHNGWSDHPSLKVSRSMFAHNLYLFHENTRNVAVTDNVVCDGANMNIQCRPGRGGCVVARNFCVDGTVQIMVAGDEARVLENVCVGGAGTTQQPDLRLGIAANSVNTEVRDNLLVGRGPSPAAHPAPAIEIGRRKTYTGAGALRAKVCGNTVYAWAGPAVQVGTPADQVELRGNVFQRLCADVVRAARAVKRLAVGGNVYDSTAESPRAWFAHFALGSAPKEQACSFERWVELSKDAGSVVRPVRFRDAQFLATWDKAQFLRNARLQRRGRWDPRFTAAAACGAFRAAFEETRTER